MRYCGREFSEDDLLLVRGLISADPAPTRYRVSFLACEALNWRKPNGKLKDMSCRVAMLRMQEDGLLKLPPPKIPMIKCIDRPEDALATAAPTEIADIDLSRLSITIVKKLKDSLLWNAYIRRYHYLGYKPIPGAQLRYVVRSENQVIALLSFGASAWKVKPRDEYIGWTKEQREKNLHLIVGNSRFLILPWIRRKNLASRVLGLIAKRLPKDWQAHYAYQPVLFETFVDARFKGTCYKAANWRCLGITQGRGKLDRLHKNPTTKKSIWAYPLKANFRQYLLG